MILTTGIISINLYQAFPQVNKRYWARGYFCVTAEEFGKEIIKECLDNQFDR